MSTFDLWLTPPDDASGQRSGLIAALSRHYGGATFDPHVTLLGSLEGEEGG